MHADSHFEIGHSHRVCQDYALHGLNAFRAPWAVLSDGCSSRADGRPGDSHTDVGARLWCWAYAAAVEFGPMLLTSGSDDHAPLGIRRLWKDIPSSLFPKEALYATLGIIQPHQDSPFVDVALWGDGVVSAKRRDQDAIEHWIIEYPSGAPYYPIYHQWTKLRWAYEDQLGIRRTIQHSEGSSELNTHDPFLRTFFLDEYEWVAIASDGVQSFQRRTGASFEPIPVQEVLAELYAFKGYAGEFVHRRMQAFRKFCEKNGWRHEDDLTVAALHLGD